MKKSFCYKTIHNNPIRVVAFGSRRIYSVVPLKTYDRIVCYYVPSTYIVEIIYCKYKLQVKIEVNEVGSIYYSVRICNIQKDFIKGVILFDAILECFSRYLTPIKNTSKSVTLHDLGISVSAVQRIIYNELFLRPTDKRYISAQPVIGKEIETFYGANHNRKQYIQTTETILKNLLRKEKKHKNEKEEQLKTMAACQRPH